jgi:hypothetical protein
MESVSIHQIRCPVDETTTTSFGDDEKHETSFGDEKTGLGMKAVIQCQK